MPEPTVLNMLIGSNGALWGLLLYHMFKCRDVRLDISKLKQRERYDDQRRRKGIPPIGRQS